LSPKKEQQGSWFKGAKRERSHAQDALASEHGEHPPLEAGFLMVLGLNQSKDVSPICAFAFGEF